MCSLFFDRAAITAAIRDGATVPLMVLHAKLEAPLQLRVATCHLVVMFMFFGNASTGLCRGFGRSAPDCWLPA